MEPLLEEEDFVIAMEDKGLQLLKKVQFRELTVIKKNGRRTQFDREKLAKSILMALKKRPIDPDTIEKVVTKNFKRT